MKRTATNPKWGPFHHRAPSRVFHRVVRGMLPHKTTRGATALNNLKVSPKTVSIEHNLTDGTRCSMAALLLMILRRRLLCRRRCARCVFALEWRTALLEKFRSVLDGNIGEQEKKKKILTCSDWFVSAARLLGAWRTLARPRPSSGIWSARPRRWPAPSRSRLPTTTPRSSPSRPSSHSTDTK